ncbi:MAG: hypothetical protein AB7S71_07835 [Dongiaceae bacterium]
MKEVKRKRLEAAGWKVGSAADFLALDNEEAASDLRTDKVAICRAVGGTIAQHDEMQRSDGQGRRDDDQEEELE